MSDNEIQQRVVKIIVDTLDIEEEKISPNAKFVEDLGLDSLDQVEFTMALEEEFGCEINDDEAKNIITVQDAVNAIKQLTQNA